MIFFVIGFFIFLFVLFLLFFNCFCYCYRFVLCFWFYILNFFQVWRDVKSRISLKAREQRKAKAATGNKPIKDSNLTEFELRVIGVVGSEYVEGNEDCADSLPEEEVNNKI